MTVLEALVVCQRACAEFVQAEQRHADALAAQQAALSARENASREYSIAREKLREAMEAEAKATPKAT